MRILYPDGHNFQGVFSDWVENIFYRVENHNDYMSGSVVLFIENLDVNVTKFKKEFFKR